MLSFQYENKYFENEIPVIHDEGEDCGIKGVKYIPHYYESE